jgi:hypothetical protein
LNYENNDVGIELEKENENIQNNTFGQNQSKFTPPNSIKEQKSEKFPITKLNTDNNKIYNTSNHQKNFETKEKEVKNRLTPDDIKKLIENKRSELDLKIYDMVTKYQIQENTFEEMMNNEENEEKKARLQIEFEELIKNNEKNINGTKEYFK